MITNICTHKGGRITINRRVVDDVIHRTYRCYACGENWRTMELPATQEALERAYVQVKRKRRSEATRKAAEAWL
jgi:transcriptional regulator NrdR family protein